MEQLANQWPFIVSCIIAFNLLLSGFHKALEVIKDKTSTDLDNKLYDIVGKIAQVLQKIIDYIGMNRAH